MNRSICLKRPGGNLVYVSAAHVVAVYPAIPMLNQPVECIVELANGSDYTITASGSAESIAALVWPERWQSVSDDSECAPDIAPPDGWEAIGPWVCGGFTAVQQSMSWQRSYGVLWTRPLRRVAVLA